VSRSAAGTRVRREIALAVARHQDHDYPCTGRRDPLGRLDSADARHLDVDQDEIGLERLGERDGLFAGVGFCEELEARRGAKDRPSSLPERRVIVPRLPPSLSPGVGSCP
jgi:hypothetical protein